MAFPVKHTHTHICVDFADYIETQGYKFFQTLIYESPMESDSLANNSR